ncbi:MAG: right-handed parallel beta-helix repeat-containing protein [Lentisphaerae bacterium]|nr:right-handed parallel beta-helix repeat-containing protein [Lentisphaerota bacterium]
MNTTPSSTPSRQARLATLLVLMLTFALSRAWFWWLGVRFDASGLDWYWQYLDPAILRDHLVAALVNLHAQPPGFNAFLGIILKLGGAAPAAAFHATYLALGFLLYVALYGFLRLRAFSRPVALACALAYAVSPNAILYENWLFYEYPVAAMLTLAAVALHRFQSTRQPGYAGAFLLLVLCACLTRSMFHLVFLLACAVLVLVPSGRQRPRVALYAGVAVGTLALFYLKNLILFGFFGASSWAGMNLFYIASHAVGTNTVAQLVQAGDIPAVAGVKPFSPLREYAPAYRADAPTAPDAPELSDPGRASGYPNYNHGAFVGIARDYQRAATWIIRHYPRQYLASVLDAWLVFSQPAWDYFYLKDNRAALQSYLDVVSAWRLRAWVDIRPVRRVIFGNEGPPTLCALTSLLLIPPLVVLFALIGWRQACRLIRDQDVSVMPVVFMCASVVYVAVLGNAMDIGENNRFRATVDPLIYLLSVLTVRAAAQRLRGWWGARRGIGSAAGTVALLLAVGLSRAETAGAVTITVTPDRSIEVAARDLKAGDTLLLKPGVYRQSATLEGLKGEAGKPITIHGEPGAILEPTERDGILVLGGGTTEYLVLEGLTVRGALRTGILINQSRHIIIRQCVLANNRVWGIQTVLSDDILVDGCDTYGSRSQHGMYFSTTDHPTVRRCRIHDNAGCGLHFNGDLSEGGDGMVTGPVIEDNVIYGNGKAGGSAINMDGGDQAVIRNNLIFDNAAGGITSFKGNALRAGDGHRIENNTIFFAPGVGRFAVQLMGEVKHVVLQHNVLVSGRGPVLDLAGTAVSGLQADHNVYYMRGTGNVIAVDDVRMDLTRWRARSGQDTNSIYVNPGFVDPAATNFVLQVTRPPGSAPLGYQPPAPE